MPTLRQFWAVFWIPRVWGLLKRRNDRRVESFFFQARVFDASRILFHSAPRTQTRRGCSLHHPFPIPAKPFYSSKPPKNLYPTCHGSKSTRDLYSVKPSTLPVLVSQTFHGNCDDKSKENLRKLKIRNSQSIVGRSLTAPIQYPSFY